ncbi:hypothetical protein KEM60_03100 [Austwickia sp. TVS 96-490-7B]|uniref:hypothetical protein n=1 Tax=Austwickia sp. TVS 96-490-7B TaxID=2830843 RepID=UPI001C57CE9C|nr:hypothetical protein [Austwickia sp. TVS 96-490-7B]MBW3086871.1 hypothetical protein [Austwickia sp. TVS 96-490-7B]
MFLAVICLVAAVTAYGWSGLRLASGSRDEKGAVASTDWWVGTGLQGVGFVTALLARTELPLLLVQSAIAAALAVTALLEHATGVRRLSLREAATVSVVVAGIGAIAVAVVPGPTRAATTGDVVAMWVLVCCCAAVIAWVHHPWVAGALAGTAFGTGAVGARLLVGSGASLAEVAQFWGWSWLMWAVAVLMPMGIVVGQWALTRGLARGASVTVLGGNYAMAAVMPSAFGVVVLGEQLRAGWWPVAVAGVAAALWGTRKLLRTH